MHILRAMTTRGVRYGGIAISVVSIGLVVAWALRQEPPHLPTSGPKIAALVGALVLYAANTCLRGERWLRLLRHQGMATPRRPVYELTVAGYAGNNLLPARAGDLVRILLLPNSPGRRIVAGTLVAERMLDVVVVLALLAVTAIGVVSSVPLPGDRALLVAGSAVVAVAVALFVVGWVYHRKHGLERVLRFLAPVAAAPRALLRGRHGAAMLALTVVVWIQEAAVWWATGEAAGVRMTPLEAVYLVALASLFSMIPSGPGYAGTQDAATILGARAVGASGRGAVSYLLLIRFVLIVPITVAGLAILALRYGGVRRVRRLVSA
jgi:uncharacterized membrane protein YbhN (UPF0104 family)